MEWCSHCCRFCQTRLYVYDEFSSYFCSTCTSCGKVLSDISTPLQIIIPNKKRKDKSSRRMKRVGKSKHDVKAEITDLSSNDEKIDCDTVSVDAVIKEEMQPVNSNNSQTSDNH